MTRVEATCNNCTFSIRDGVRRRCGFDYYQIPANERKTPKLTTFPEVLSTHSCPRWSDKVNTVLKPTTKTPEVIYYLPGLGGRLSAGLGQALMDRGYDVTGRESIGAFKELGFTRQVELVASDIKEYFWRQDARIICNSFGAYLFLHAQALIGEPYIGKVILLSPIVGEFANNNEIRPMNFIPPQADGLLALVTTGKFPIPLHCEIHVGSEDWQSYPNATAFGQIVGIQVSVIEGVGHGLPTQYVSELLDRWGK